MSPEDTGKLPAGHDTGAFGDARMATMELIAVRLDLLNAKPESDGGLSRPAVSGPGGARRDRNERILVLTYALGDLYVGPIGEPERARKLYEETLQQLYGFPGVDPLRQRLSQLQESSSYVEFRETAPTGKDRIRLE